MEDLGFLPSATSSSPDSPMFTYEQSSQIRMILSLEDRALAEKLRNYTEEDVTTSILRLSGVEVEMGTPSLAIAFYLKKYKAAEVLLRLHLEYYQQNSPDVCPRQNQCRQTALMFAVAFAP